MICPMDAADPHASTRRGYICECPAVGEEHSKARGNCRCPDMPSRAKTRSAHCICPMCKTTCRRCGDGENPGPRNLREAILSRFAAQPRTASWTATEVSCELWRIDWPRPSQERLATELDAMVRDGLLRQRDGGYCRTGVVCAAERP